MTAKNAFDLFSWKTVTLRHMRQKQKWLIGLKKTQRKSILEKKKREVATLPIVLIAHRLGESYDAHQGWG